MATDEGGTGLVDISALVTNTGGDRNLVEMLFNLFLEDMPRLLLKVESEHGDGKTVEMGRTAHGLKGSAAAIGASAVRDKARAVELAETEKRSEDYAGLIQELKDACEQTQVAIQQFLAEGMPGL